ncbi:MAG: hypothetical protein CMI60_12250 [Parvibaculum sp.]|jgi:uncharacterized protein (DUF983 family)|nr:hypothetical protein [Parvibaculum sp.]|tara:strand:- start:8488 stop:8883 length:396 start_codon:yes stop_codon:yes gene_type:complete
MTSIADTADEPRSVWRSIRRGAAFKCPSCGEGQIFRKYLKITDNCSQCGEELHHHRADDAPPYFTIFIVGHMVVPAMLWIEMSYRPDVWVHAAIWGPLTLALTLTILPITKGTVVGMQWAVRMHGFGGQED